MHAFQKPVVIAALSICVAAALLSPPAQAADGKTVYDANCAMCHAAGLANAPKFGDQAAWAPRVATGKEVLLKSVTAGKGAMPPKAGNPKLSDDEIKVAIDYMVAAAK